MKEHGVLFSGEMVRAIQAGRKTQTRRPVDKRWQRFAYAEPLPAELAWIDGAEEVNTMAFPGQQPGDYLFHNGIPVRGGEWQPVSPPWRVGDRLWVRETWTAVWPGLDKVPLKECKIEYRADLPAGCTDYPGQWPAELARGNPDAPKWRPSIHMPRWASRLNLEVTGLWVERVQKISGMDAKREGMAIPAHMPQDGADLDWARQEFRRVWDGLYAKRGLGWVENPWVWVTEFQKI